MRSQTQNSTGSAGRIQKQTTQNTFIRLGQAETDALHPHITWPCLSTLNLDEMGDPRTRAAEALNALGRQGSARNQNLYGLSP